MKRVTALTTLGLYTLLAFLSVMVSDFHDRSWPQELGARSQITLDFSDSTVNPDDALGLVEQLGDEHGLGLFRVVPDLEDTDREVLVALGGQSQQSVGFFGDKPEAEIVGPARLANSSASGTYLVQHPAELSEAVDALSAQDVSVVRSDASLKDTAIHMAAEAGFIAPFTAGCLLVAAMTVFWLAAKARSRALRVLAGGTPWRIQLQDVGAFFGILLGSALAVLGLSALLVGLLHGWVYVPMYAALFGSFAAITALASMAVVMATSFAAWPNADLFAFRRPAIGILKTPARVVQGVTLLALITFAAPTWAATQSAAQTARQLQVWNELSEQVRIQFTLSDEEMDRIAERFATAVASAEPDGQAALSYTLTEQVWEGDFGDYSAISIVTPAWIDLVSGSEGQHLLVPVDTAAQVPMLERELRDQFEVLQPESGSVDELFDTMRLHQPATGEYFPVSAGGTGQLVFLDDVLVIEIPSIVDLFDAPNTVSIASTGNVVMTGVDTTQARLDGLGLNAAGLAELGIDGTIRPVYMAEEGILEAQYATYLAGLLQVSLAALFLAFLVAAGVNAMISAVLHAHRDFPLRLSGASWESVVRHRALRDVVLGAGVALLVFIIGLRDPSTLGITALAAALGLSAVYLSHFAAASVVFGRVIHRKL